MPKKILMETEVKNEVKEEKTNTNNADLSAILAQLQEQSKMIAKQAEMIDELKGNKWPKRNIEVGNPKFKVRVIGDKIIASVRMLKNKVERNLSTGGFNEDQSVEVTYTDESKETMLYADYVNAYTFSKLLEAKVIDDNVRVTLKDETEQVIPLTEFNRKFKIRVKGINEPVINHEIVESAEMLSKYTFETPKYNDGKPFVVDHTAIN